MNVDCFVIFKRFTASVCIEADHVIVDSLKNKDVLITIVITFSSLIPILSLGSVFP